MKATCPNCKFQYEMVTKEKVQRSNPQNRYLFGVVYPIISEHTGFTAEEVHEWAKLEFNSKIVYIGNDEVKIGMSTASLKTDSFNVYIEKIVRFASITLGLNIPEPNEPEIAQDGTSKAR